MPHTSKGKAPKKKVPDSSKEIEELLDKLEKANRLTQEHFRKYTEFENLAMEYQQALEGQQAELDQISDSADTAQRARGLIRDFETGPEEESYRKSNRRVDFRRQIENLQTSVDYYRSEAAKCKRKYDKRQSEKAELESKLQDLGENPIQDTDNWFIPGTDSQPKFDDDHDDGGAGPVNWYGAGSGTAY